MLAGLLNIPTDAPSRGNWSFIHQDQHAKIVSAVFTQKSQELPSFSFDPMPDPDPKDGNFITWVQNHQAAHTAFTSVLGIDGNDLSDVDFSKPDQMETWIRLHFSEHYFAQLNLQFPD